VTVTRVSPITFDRSLLLRRRLRPPLRRPPLQHFRPPRPPLLRVMTESRTTMISQRDSQR
jgi:hypothetical protein